jgi:hypothetical protein
MITDWTQSTFFTGFSHILPLPNSALGLVDKRKQLAKEYLRQFGVVVSQSTKTGSSIEFTFYVDKWADAPNLNKSEFEVKMNPQFLTVSVVV